MLNLLKNHQFHQTDVSGGVLVLGDCLEVMKYISSKSIQLILADLPYGTTACKWDSIIPLETLWEQYKRIIKDNGAIVLTASQPFTTKLISSNYEMFKYEWIWEKSKASNFLQASYMSLKAHENILVFAKGKPKYNPQKTSGKPYNKGKDKRSGIATEVYKEIPNINGFELVNETGLRNPRSVQYFVTAEREGKFHPTQKPKLLMKFLIKTYTDENDLVLDNTMGSGTTCLSAKELNRKFIGIEKEKKYYDIAVARICGS